MPIEKKKILPFMVFIPVFLFLSSIVSAGEVAFSGAAVNVTDATPYLYGRVFQFNITLNASTMNLVMEHNFTGAGALVNTSNITTFLAQGANFEYYTTLISIPAGTRRQYRFFANDTAAGDHTISGIYNYSASKSGILITILLNNTAADDDRWWQNATAVNITVLPNITSYRTETLKFNISTNRTGAVETMWRENTSTVLETKIMAMNITGYFETNVNYTAASTTRYLLLRAPYFERYDLNVSYINFNQSVLLTAELNNSFAVKTIVAEINTSGSTGTNATLAASATAGNYTYEFSKSELGQIQANATTIHVKRVVIVDTDDSGSSNVTLLSFDFAKTTLNGASVPEPVASTESSVIVWAHYNESDGTALTFNCTVALFELFAGDNPYIHARTEAEFNPSGKAATTYTYNITCLNTSYQSQTTSGSLNVIGGLAGSDGGTGGPTGVTTTTTVPAVVGAYCGNGICEIGETWLNCWADCPLISLPGGQPSPGATTTTVPSAGGPVTVTPEQQETIMIIVVLAIVGFAILKFFKFL